MMLLHDLLVALSIYCTHILCAQPIAVLGISMPDSLHFPLIFSKPLSLVSLFSVGIPSNLRQSLLLYCSSSSISCWFWKF